MSCRVSTTEPSRPQHEIGKLFVLTFLNSPEEFESQAANVARGWAVQLAGKKFHVRMHRRSFQGQLSSQHEEHFLDHVLLEELARMGSSGQITFDDPDVIIAVETVGNRAGLSLWSRDDLRRFPLVKLD